MEELTKNLEDIGLSNKESQVYLALLKNSMIGGGELSKILSMDRTHTYNILRNLINKGLVSSIIKERKTLFHSESPKNLLNQIRKKEDIIKSIIPKLESITDLKTKKSTVTILEGKEGVRTVIRMLFESKSREIYVYGGTGKSYEALSYEMPFIAKRTMPAKIRGKIITGESLRGKLFTKLKNFEIKYIDELTPSSTMIFGNTVSINIFDEKISIIVIESKSVADSYRKYFDTLWKISKK